METYNFAIDLCAEHIAIYRAGQGVVLSESPIVLLSGKGKNPKEIYCGDEANELINKIEDCKVCYPTACGKITDFDNAVILVNNMLKKVEDRSILKKRNLIFLVPCGLSKADLDRYMDLGYALSAKNVKLIPRVQTIARLNQKKDKLSNMYIVLNKDYFDIAVIYNNSIVRGYTIDLGYSIITNNIERYIFANKQAELDEKTLDEITFDLATVIPNDSVEEKYTGLESYTKQAIDFKISSLEVVNYYTSYACEVCDIIEAIMRTLSREIVAELKVAGATISGKIAKITGLTKFLSSRLNFDVIASEHDEYSALLGVGSIMTDLGEIDKIAIDNKI